jgi:predicted peptidase
MREVEMLSIVVSLMMLESALSQADATVAQYEEHRYELKSSEGSLTLPYRLLKPATIEPGKKYPLVLFLHGAGERGDDNRKQLLYLPERMVLPALREQFPCFLLAPQCPAGKRWVEVPWEAEQSTPMTDPTPQIQAVMQVLRQRIESDQVDPQRVYLTGLSMGGYGVWDLAMRHPQWFAAVAPICAGGDESKAEQLARVSVWAFHGDADKVVQAVRSRRMIEAIRGAGGQPKYTELPAVGHNSWNHAYSDESGLLDWMFSQRNPR